MDKIAVIGMGFMGSAVAGALRRSHASIELAIVEKDAARRDTVVRELGAIDFSTDPQTIWDWADLVVLAMKPQDLETAAELTLPEKAGTEGVPGTVPIVSVLAGTSIATISKVFRTPLVVRMMPNLAADIGKAVVGVTTAPDISPTLKTSILKTFARLGTLIEIPESNMAAITGLAGSGIAFVFEFTHALALGGVAEGLPYPRALEAACDVVESAAMLLRENGVHPEEMVSRVCSPAGTTIAGVKALARGGMRAVVMDAVGAAAARSRDLEG